MSNYRESYYDALRIGRQLTAKQRRRLDKKEFRDRRRAAVGSPVGNPNPPASLSGHPGRRRAQLTERAAVAVEREIARALRHQEAMAKRRPSGASIAHALFGGTR